MTIDDNALGDDMLLTMFDWFIQAYRKGQSFDVPIPFTTAAAAVAAGDWILRHGLYSHVQVYHAFDASVHLDLVRAGNDIACLASTLEKQLHRVALAG